MAACKKCGDDDRTSQGRCRTCAKEYALLNKDKIAARMKAWYDNNRDRQKATAALYQDTYPKRFRVTHMLNMAKIRAEQGGIPFNLVPDDLLPAPDFCPALGIPLKYTRGKRTDGSASLDRFIPELGYVPGNVSIVSNLANLIKTNATAAEVRAVADWMEKQCLASQASPATPNSTP